MNNEDENVNKRIMVTSVVKEMESEPVNNAHKVEEEDKSNENESASQGSGVTMSDNVPESQDIKSDEGQDEFYDAENAIIESSQEPKDKIPCEGSEVDDVFMELPDENFPNSGNAEENIKHVTSHIVISDIFSAEEAKKEITKMADNSIDAENIELEGEVEYSNDFETSKSMNEEDLMMDKSQYEKNDNDVKNNSVAKESDNLEKAIESENLPQNSNEKEALPPPVVEMEAITEEKQASETEKIEKEEAETNELQQDDHLKLTLNDELEAKKKEENQIVLLSRETPMELEIEFEENYLVESLTDKSKNEHISKLNESLDLFASESDDLENLTGAQSITQATDANIMETTLLESQHDNIEPKKNNYENDIRQENEEPRAPVGSDTEIVKVKKKEEIYK